jgi:hypothetical protein
MCRAALVNRDCESRFVNRFNDLTIHDLTIILTA